jgi:Helicase HerA, central domain
MTNPQRITPVLVCEGQLSQRPMPLVLLPRHVAILAGSGSGKTVLLRRVVEEAALLGIPSIVLDINNDLATLGDRWPTRPVGFSEDDGAKAAAYHNRTDVVIWTPGVSSGNPVSLNLLPNFARIGQKQDKQTGDEREQAVEMARATLAPYLGGSGQKAFLKQGVLADALRVFANGGSRGRDPPGASAPHHPWQGLRGFAGRERFPRLRGKPFRILDGDNQEFVPIWERVEGHTKIPMAEMSLNGGLVLPPSAILICSTPTTGTDAQGGAECGNFVQPIGEEQFNAGR